MFPILQVGPVALQTPGLILLIGLWVGLSFSERHAHRFGIRPDNIYNLTFIMLISGVIGARLSVAARFPNAFIETPISLVSLNPSLFDPIGGYAVAVLAGLIFANRKGLKVGAAMDALTPALGILAVAISLSHLASGTAFGQPTNAPWGILLWGEHRHPTQIYQALLQGLIVWVLWPGRSQNTQPAGKLFLRWVAFSAGARIFVETFRADSLLMPNGLRFAQLAAWAVLALSLIALQKIQTEQTAIK